MKTLATFLVLLCLSAVASVQALACELQEARVADGHNGRTIEVCLRGDKNLEFKLPRGTAWYELFKPNENNAEFRKQVEAATGTDFDTYMEVLAGVDDPVGLYSTNEAALRYLALKYTQANSAAPGTSVPHSIPATEPAASGT